MEIGLIIKYGRLVPGRERQALDLFGEAAEWFAEQLKTGIITYYEPFFFTTGDLYDEVGFWIVKGERDKIWKMVEDEHYLWLMSKAQFLVDHLQFEWLVFGERIPEQLERTTKLAAEFATVP